MTSLPGLLEWHQPYSTVAEHEQIKLRSFATLQALGGQESLAAVVELASARAPDYTNGIDYHFWRPSQLRSYNTLAPKCWKRQLRVEKVRKELHERAAVRSC